MTLEKGEELSSMVLCQILSGRTYRGGGGGPKDKTSSCRPLTGLSSFEERIFEGQKRVLRTRKGEVSGSVQTNSMKRLPRPAANLARTLGSWKNDHSHKPKEKVPACSRTTY